MWHAALFSLIRIDFGYDQVDWVTNRSKSKYNTHICTYVNMYQTTHPFIFKFVLNRCWKLQFQLWIYTVQRTCAVEIALYKIGGTN